MERGNEYKVGDKRFDGYDPERDTLLDAKDWENYPPEGTDFWKDGVIDDAEEQLKAAKDTGCAVEWNVSTEEKSDMIRDLFDNERINIDVVHVPKR